MKSTGSIDHSITQEDLVIPVMQGNSQILRMEKMIFAPFRKEWSQREVQRWDMA